MVKTCGGPWKPCRPCNAHDLILVSEGLQCGNCGAVNPGTRKEGKTNDAQGKTRSKDR